MAAPNERYRSGNHNAAAACSARVFSAPFEGIEAEYLMSQDFQQDEDHFQPLPLDTQAGAAGGLEHFRLVSETNKISLGGGFIRWTRNFAKLPAEYTEPRGNISFTFPGFSGVVPGVGTVGFGGDGNGRDPLNDNVPVKVLRTFFQTTNPFDDIPIIKKFSVSWQNSNNVQNYLADANAFGVATTPSQSVYNAFVSGGTYIVAQDSTWQRWLGNIWVRETFYVKAQ